MCPAPTPMGCQADPEPFLDTDYRGNHANIMRLFYTIPRERLLFFIVPRVTLPLVAYPRLYSNAPSEHVYLSNHLTN